MKSDNFQRRVDDEKVEGWRVKTDGDERVVMRKPDYGSLGGHVIVAILTFWTVGFGNACYAGYKYFTSPEKVVRDEEAEDRRLEEERERGSASSTNEGTDTEPLGAQPAASPGSDL